MRNLLNDTLVIFSALACLAVGVLWLMLARARRLIYGPAVKPIPSYPGLREHLREHQPYHPFQLDLNPPAGAPGPSCKLCGGSEFLPWHSYNEFKTINEVREEHGLPPIEGDGFTTTTCNQTFTVGADPRYQVLAPMRIVDALAYDDGRRKAKEDADFLRREISGQDANPAVSRSRKRKFRT